MIFLANRFSGCMFDALNMNLPEKIKKIKIFTFVLILIRKRLTKLKKSFSQSLKSFKLVPRHCKLYVEKKSAGKKASGIKKMGSKFAWLRPTILLFRPKLNHRFYLFLVHGLIN
jgi:hypothetical protein